MMMENAWKIHQISIENPLKIGNPKKIKRESMPNLWNIRRTIGRNHMKMGNPKKIKRESTPIPAKILRIDRKLTEE